MLSYIKLRDIEADNQAKLVEKLYNDVCKSLAKYFKNYDANIKISMQKYLESRFLLGPEGLDIPPKIPICGIELKGISNEALKKAYVTSVLELCRKRRIVELYEYPISLEESENGLINVWMELLS
jgi:hypothetical protein